MHGGEEIDAPALEPGLGVGAGKGRMHPRVFLACAPGQPEPDALAHLLVQRRVGEHAHGPRADGDVLGEVRRDDARSGRVARIDAIGEAGLDQLERGRVAPARQALRRAAARPARPGARATRGRGERAGVARVVELAQDLQRRGRRPPR